MESPDGVRKVHPVFASSEAVSGAAQAELGSVSPAFRAACPLRGLWVKLRTLVLPAHVFRTESCV